jgi:uncharacterized membrane protein
VETRTGSRNPNATDFFFLRRYDDVNLSIATGNGTFALTTNSVSTTNYSDLVNLTGFYQEMMILYLKLTWVPAAWIVNGTGDSLTLGTGGSVGAGVYMAASNAASVPTLNPVVLLGFQNCKFGTVGKMLTHSWKNPRTGSDATFYAVGTLIPQFGGIYLAYDGPIGTPALFLGQVVSEVGIAFRTRV